QSLHQPLADSISRELLLRTFLEQVFHFVDHGFETAHRDGPLLAGLHQSGEELVAVERLPAAVLLDDHVRDLINPLIGRESPGAGEAFPAAPRNAPPLPVAAVDDLALGAPANRA